MEAFDRSGAPLVFLAAFWSRAIFDYRLRAAGALVSDIGTRVQRTARDRLVLSELTHHSASVVGIVMAL